MSTNGPTPVRAWFGRLVRLEIGPGIVAIIREPRPDFSESFEDRTRELLYVSEYLFTSVVSERRPTRTSLALLCRPPTPFLDAPLALNFISIILKLLFGHRLVVADPFAAG